MIEKYICEIEELRARLIETESMVEIIKRSSSRPASSRMLMSPMSGTLTSSMMSSSIDYSLSPDDHVTDILDVAKKEIMMEKEKVKKLQAQQQHSTK